MHMFECILYSSLILYRFYDTYIAKFINKYWTQKLCGQLKPHERIYNNVAMTTIIN